MIIFGKPVKVMSTYDEIREQAKAALGELLEKSHLEAGASAKEIQRRIARA